jgi:hypothetical protein
VSQVHSFSAQPFITVVSGLPRSGTSMMMRMLDAGGLGVLTDNVREADADNPFGYYEFDPVKQLADDASWLAEARGKAVKVVYRLLYALPPSFDYRILFMRRDLHEVVASQLQMLNRHGMNPAGDATVLVNAFERELREVDRWMPAQRHFKALAVDYNLLLLDPRPQLTAIEAFLGIKLDIDAMGRLVEPSLYRQRRSTTPSSTRSGPSAEIESESRKR